MSYRTVKFPERNIITHKTTVYVPELILTDERLLYNVLVLEHNVNVLMRLREGHNTKRCVRHVTSSSGLRKFQAA
jgi:hypothetical protein